MKLDMVKIRINRNYFGTGLRWWIFLFFLIIAFYFLSNLLSPATAAIINPLDYARITPKLITFSEDEIVGNEVFYTLVSGRITWATSSPFLTLLASVTKEAKISFFVEAQNKTTGDWVTLNSAYFVYIKKPFPKRVGEYYKAGEKIPLRFPETAESGDYDVSAKLLEADAKLYFLGWVDIKGYFPQFGSLGSIKYTK